ncbi:MAG: hypothetical protein DYH12_20940 [Sorangiineae bacterium PRO1]|nr:hypothetical protein [Sorangiineae bacterium PRO1]
MQEVHRLPEGSVLALESCLGQGHFFSHSARQSASICCGLMACIWRRSTQLSTQSLAALAGGAGALLVVGAGRGGAGSAAGAAPGL